ncbi:MAG: hypothetical protein WCF65_02395 [Parachlamydiaceae bacterium]
MSGIGSRKRDENQLWPIVGPLLAFCMLIVVLFRTGSGSLGLPLMTLGGILLCYLWKWRGVAVSSVCLAVVSSYYLYQQPYSLWMWTTALSLCIVSIFVVTVLCFEEFSIRWEQLCKNAQDHRQTISHLNEQFQCARDRSLDEQRGLLLDIESLGKNLATLEQNLAVKENQIASSERLAKLARDELNAGYAHQEKILQELYLARQQHAALTVSLEVLQERFAHETDGGVRREAALAEMLQVQDSLHIAQTEVDQYQKALQAAETEIGQLHRGLEAAKTEVYHHQVALKTAEIEIEQLHKTLEATKSEVHLHQSAQHTAEIEIEQLHKTLEATKAEVHLHQSAQHTAETEIEQLHKTLEATKSEVHLHQSAQLTAEREIEQLHKTLEATKAEVHQHQSAQHTAETEIEQLNRTLEATKSDNLHYQAALQAAAAREFLVNESGNALLSEKVSLVQQLQQLREQINAEVSKQTEEIKDREIRRLEGLYLQLRQQFAQKTEVLTATRRELFTTQEMLAALQKEIEESTISDGREVHISLQKLLEEAENELESAEAEHIAEISRLHEVIDSLMTCEKHA